MSKYSKLEIQQTMEALEGLRNAHINDTYHGRQLSVMLTIAITALREQEEQKTGCAFCDEEHDEHDYMNGIQTLENGKYLVLETSEWDDYDDCFYDIRIAANFCPMCGRKLKGDGRERD